MDKLIPIYLKIKPKLKEKLQAQARTERISMASLISEMLEMGLEIRPKIRQDRLDKFVNAARGYSNAKR
jgi:hypothetical protein|tara:strand:+ start:429 stop:635 length:207 start_codon:yes stop_codon:yes gene_type:complete